jgi:hypothetical protein
MAIVTEPAGTDVPDGTVVLWTTTLGHIDRETRTVRGIARNRLVSDSRSGVAVVFAQSGADALPPPSAPPSTTPGSTTPGSTTPGPTTTTRPGATTTTIGQQNSAGSFARFAGMQNSASIDVTIGNALVANIHARAVPSRITISNSTHVIATVVDRFGNPVANVPVFFEVISNKDFEFFDSAGAPVFTDNNGEAEDVVRTRRPAAGPFTPIVVRACAAAPGGFRCTTPDLVIPIV